MEQGGRVTSQGTCVSLRAWRGSCFLLLYRFYFTGQSRIGELLSGVLTEAGVKQLLGVTRDSQLHMLF